MSQCCNGSDPMFCLRLVSTMTKHVSQIHRDLEEVTLPQLPHCLDDSTRCNVVGWLLTCCLYPAATATPWSMLVWAGWSCYQTATVSF